MVYQVCLIHEITKSNGYPYRDVALIYDKALNVYRFPEQNGDPEDERGGFRQISPELQKVLGTIEPSIVPSILDIVNGSDGKKIMVILVSNSVFVPQSESYKRVEEQGQVLRVLMDEIRQGRVCHARIYSNVRTLFFGNPTEENVIIPSTPYFYEPSSKLVPRKYCLVKAPSDTSVEFLHSPGYYRLPIVGYHGTSEAYVSNIFRDGLQVTRSYGMYGDNAYYFGNFYKAIRYAFRDSQYASMKERTKLRKTTRPSGFLEVLDTAHINRRSGDIETDLIRDSPALIRFVLFPKNVTIMPRDMRNVIGTPTLSKKTKPKTSNNFITYSRKSDGVGKTVYAPDYLDTQIGKNLFESYEGDIPEDDDYNLEVPEDTTRENVVLRLYKAIHVSTHPAFA